MAKMVVIVENKRTKETLELSYNEFEKRFAKEINDAFYSYKRTVLKNPTFKPKLDIEGDFYFDLQWNFNHHSNSNWYVKRMR